MQVGWNDKSSTLHTANPIENKRIGVDENYKPRRKDLPWYMQQKWINPIFNQIRVISSYLPHKSLRKSKELIDKELPTMEKEIIRKIKEKKMEERKQRRLERSVFPSRLIVL